MAAAPVVKALLADTAPVETTLAQAAVRNADSQRALILSGSVVAPRQALLASESAGIVERVDVRIGSRVAKGATLLALRSRPLELALDGARAELGEAEAEHRSSELRHERLRELETSQVVSRQNVDDADYQMQAIAGRVARLKARVASLVYQVKSATVRAPMAGVVVSEPAQVGQWLAAGDPVLELLADDDLEVRVDVAQKHFGRLRVGARAIIEVAALDGKKIPGSVRAVIPKANDQSRTFPVYLSLEETVGLGAGMTVSVELRIAETSDRHARVQATQEETTEETQVEWS